MAFTTLVMQRKPNFDHKHQIIPSCGLPTPVLHNYFQELSGAPCIVYNLPRGIKAFPTSPWWFYQSSPVQDVCSAR